MTNIVYVVTRRADLIAIYDNEEAAVQHACFIEETEHASVKVEIWKRRTSFDAATARKSGSSPTTAAWTPIRATSWWTGRS